jgi:cell division protein FtsB
MPSSAVLFAARGRRPRMRGISVVLVVAVVLALWVVFSFVRTLTALDATADQLAAVQAETAALELRIRQGQAEMELAQTPAFQRMLARSFGMGLPGERAFALEPGAPPAPVITPLGDDGTAPGASPLEAWLDLLVGD